MKFLKGKNIDNHKYNGCNGSENNYFKNSPLLNDVINQLDKEIEIVDNDYIIGLFYFDSDPVFIDKEFFDINNARFGDNWYAFYDEMFEKSDNQSIFFSSKSAIYQILKYLPNYQIYCLARTLNYFFEKYQLGTFYLDKKFTTERIIKLNNLLSSLNVSQQINEELKDDLLYDKWKINSYLNDMYMYYRRHSHNISSLDENEKIFSVSTMFEIIKNSNILINNHDDYSILFDKNQTLKSDFDLFGDKEVCDFVEAKMELIIDYFFNTFDDFFSKNNSDEIKKSFCDYLNYYYSVDDLKDKTYIELFFFAMKIIFEIQNDYLKPDKSNNYNLQFKLFN